MPAVRLSRRRRSSLALTALAHVKAGFYGVQTPSPRPVTFAPNVTPGTYVEPDLYSTPSSDSSSPTTQLFPPSELPASLPSRRRVPPGKRRSLGYIPRPPNAFMLFRADFVRQKHVPGSIETNHGSLSKIIGNCWRALPLEEKRIWEVKAKHAKAEHKAQYPEYRFRPVHNKNKEKKKEKPTVTPEDERRCEEVAQLLLEGMKGDELAAAVRDLDRLRSASPSLTPSPSTAVFHHRRSSSVPPPSELHPISLPSVPFFGVGDTQRYGSMSRASRIWLGQRRASSAQPTGARYAWPTMMQPPPAILHRDQEPLPEANMALFDPMFLASSNFGFMPQHESPFHLQDFMSTIPMNSRTTHDLISPLDNTDSFKSNTHPHHDIHQALDPLNWLPVDPTHSDPSSTYSGSPTPSDELSLPVHAPRPHHVGAPFESWKDMSAQHQHQQHQQQQQHQHHHQQQQQQADIGAFPMHPRESDLSLGMDLPYSQTSCISDGSDLMNYAAGIFDQGYSMHQTNDALTRHATATHDMTTPLGYTLNDMVYESY